VLLGVFAVVHTTASAPATSPNDQKYDEFFKKYTAYFGNSADWRVFKAHAIVESGLRPTVVSPDKLKDFLDRFKKGWKPEWGGEIVDRVKGGFGVAKEGFLEKIKPKLRRGGDWSSFSAGAGESVSTAPARLSCETRIVQGAYPFAVAVTRSVPAGAS